MKNVIYDDGKELIPGTIDYTYKIILNLKKLLPNFKDYLFIVYNHLGEIPPASRNFKHDKKILFWEAGEGKKFPLDEIRSDYRHIFANYARSRGNIHSIPLGYWDSKVIGEIIPMSERMYNISFVGCLNKNRVHLASLLSGKKKESIALALDRDPKKTLGKLNRIIQWRYTSDFIHFTDDFAAGFDREKYSYILRNSKVVLCPRGWINSECFRMYEAMMHECVVISEQLPEREYYENIPTFQVDKWKEGWYLARKLVKEPERLVKLGRENRQFYKERFDPKEVAKRVAKIILKRA